MSSHTYNENTRQQPSKSGQESDSTAALEATFFAGISLTGVACYYGHSSVLFVLFAIVQSAILTIILVYLWPSGQPRRFHATRSACTKHRILAVEFCVLVHLICACLSLLGRIQQYAIVLRPWLPALELGTIMTLELIASIAVILSHATGHHDFCLRVKRRIAWFGRGIKGLLCCIGKAFHCMLEELPHDLECQSDNSNGLLGWPGTKGNTLPPAQSNHTMKEDSSSSKEDILESPIEEVSRQPHEEQLEHLQQMRRAPSTYDLIHQELRSIGARVRWSAVRYAMFPKLQRTPFQDLSLLVAVQAPAYPPIDDCEHLHQSQPLYQFSRRPRSKLSTSNMTSTVMDMVDRNNALGISQLQPLQISEQLRRSPIQRDDRASQPYIQLPGKIYNVQVEALPDTGSSQNVIDAAFVNNLYPTVEVHPLSDSDKPLRAPDEELIPCEGKVHLPWLFAGEDEILVQWFYVVNDCSHDVIIGNGLLKETETMEKHQHRLKITEPDPDSLPGNLVSEAQELDRLRQVVLGKVNGVDMKASLDTGCEANLISWKCAEDLELKILGLPKNKRNVTFANGRTGETLGLVEIDWSFADTPEVSTKVKCYVLPKCIHSVIFGARFAVLENPWNKHALALDLQVLTDAGDAGVVDLKKKLFGKKKIDPQAAAEQKLKDEKFDRLEGILASSAAAQVPAVPPRAMLAPAAAGPSSAQAGLQSLAASPLSQTPTLAQSNAPGPSSLSSSQTPQASVGGTPSGQNVGTGTVTSPAPVAAASTSTP